MKVIRSSTRSSSATSGSPFPEEDIAGLTELIGADRVPFGSDWPHAEGTPQPADHAKYLEELDPGHAPQILRDNALALVS